MGRLNWAAVEAEGDSKRYKAEKQKRKGEEHEAGRCKDSPTAGCPGCEPWLIPYGVTPDPDPPPNFRPY